MFPVPRCSKEIVRTYEKRNKLGPIEIDGLQSSGTAIIPYTNSVSIRFDLKRKTETEPNEFRTNVDLPPATVSKSDQILRKKGGVGGLLVAL